MGEYERLQKEINRLKVQQAKSNKISRAKGEIRELKYGKYFKPGRKMAAAIGRSGKRAGGWIKKQASGGTGQYGGENMFGGLEMGNPFGGGEGPLADIGEINMGNPFGEPERHRTARRHHRKPRK